MLNTIQNNISKKQIEIPEIVINNQIKNDKLKIVIHDNYIVVIADNIEAILRYHSYNFDQHNGSFSITCYLTKIKPFYMTYCIPMIGKKYSFIEYQNKLITCKFDQIPEITNIIKNAGCKDITSIEFKKGKILVEFISENELIPV